MLPLAGTVIVEVIVPVVGMLMGMLVETYSLQLEEVKLNSADHREVAQLFV